MKYILNTIAAITCLALVACGGSDEPDTTEVAEVPADADGLSECCTASMALVAQMEECCRTGISKVGELSGCCATGMLDETADADRPDCCTKGKALLDQMSECCKATVLTGEPGGCCEAMPAALLAQAPE